MSVLIGTHDSCAYKLDFSIGFWSTFNKFELLRKVCAKVSSIRNKVSKATLTQKHTIQQQLEMGCRVLDIRVSFKNGVFYTNHTFCCGTLNEMMTPVKSFASGNKETVLLLIKPDWETRHTIVNRERELLRFLETKFGSLLTQGRVVCYYQARDTTIYKSHPAIKKFSAFTFVWLNANQVDAFIAKYKKLPSLSNSILNYVLTPNTDDWRKFDLEKFAKELNPTVEVVVSKRNLPKIFLIDFIDPVLCNRLKQLFATSPERSDPPPTS